MYTYSYSYSGHTLFALGSFSAVMADSAFNVTASTSRSPLYLMLNFLGADSTNLYFRDGATDGLEIAPIDPPAGVYHVSLAREIESIGNPTMLRNGSHFKVAFNSYPSNTPSVDVFNIDSMSLSKFQAPPNSSIDLVGDTIMVLTGNRVVPYLPDGTALPMVTLATIDTAATELFAATASRLFLQSNGSLKIFSRSGDYDTAFAFTAASSSQLFAYDATLRGNSPPNVMSLSTGKVTLPPNLSYGGYWLGDAYWCPIGYNVLEVYNQAVTSAGENKAMTPAGFSLEQNYPNPFNPLTIIKYTVGGVRDPGPGIRKIRLVVYDLLGRQVATLVDEEKAPGSYEVRFSANGACPPSVGRGSASGGDGSGLASGVYFYRLTAGPFVQSRKMMLLK